jgi:transposase-like protein
VVKNKPRRGSWYQRDGTYASKCQGKRVQRFICKRCGKKFSTQTFSLDYGVKKRIPYRRVFDQINSGSGIRFLARNLGVTDKVITNRISRLARQAIGIHALLKNDFHLTEDLAADGFESFTWSQYFPNNIHLAVGKESQYLYGIDYAHIRRKGRMTEKQKLRRETLEKRWKAPPGDISASFARLVRHILRYRKENEGDPPVLYTDEKQEYRQVLKGVEGIRHLTISSHAARTVRNDLFAVNYYDREIRKDQSNHTRETVEFSRDVNNAMDRLWMYSAYHNYLKPYRTGRNGGKMPTHAECAGIPPGSILRVWKSFFTRRFFAGHLDLSDSQWYSWYRCYATPLKREVPWYPRYAAA